MRGLFTSFILIAASCTILHAAMPEGWFLAGNKPAEYDCSRDPETSYQGRPSVYLRSKEGTTTTGFGTLMQDFNATNYRGKRVQYSAAVKSEGVTSEAGLWMRVDNNRADRNHAQLSFDNMHDRAITGTTPWQRYSVVLDVPQESTGIFLGILLEGPGAVWISDGKFEVVGSDVPVTGHYQPPPASSSGTVSGTVTMTDTDLYHVVLPAKARWGASIPNPGGQEVTIFNVAGKVCWDPNPQVIGGCNGPDGSGRIPSKHLGKPEEFLAPDKAAGSLVTKLDGGRTYFSINDREKAFDDNSGQFEFDVKLAGAPQK